jgi:hypothetical protein
VERGQSANAIGGAHLRDPAGILPVNRDHCLIQDEQVLGRRVRRREAATVEGIDQSSDSTGESRPLDMRFDGLQRVAQIL